MAELGGELVEFGKKRNKDSVLLLRFVWVENVNER